MVDRVGVEGDSEDGRTVGVVEDAGVDDGAGVGRCGYGIAVYSERGRVALGTVGTRGVACDLAMRP